MEKQTISGALYNMLENGIHSRESSKRRGEKEENNLPEWEGQSGVPTDVCAENDHLD